MNKKIILIIIVIVVICICIGVFLFINNSKINNGLKENTNNEASKNETDITKEENTTNEKNSVVLYFSATGNTKEVAQRIKEASGSDIIEIIPKEKYTAEDLSYNSDDSRANKEQNDDSARPQILNNIDIEKYDVIYLGYPIWWGDIPKIILTLLDTYDFSGKTIIAFCTSGGSSISQSQNTLKTYKNLNVIDGKKFNSSVTTEEVKSWISGLNIK